MEMPETLEFASSSEWRRWLQANHKEAKYVWLTHFKKASGKTGLTYSEALDEALCFGWIDGGMRSIDKDKYKIRYSPRKKKSVWSKKNRDRAEALVKEGRMTQAGIYKIEEAMQNGLWDIAYTSREKEEIPPDLREALKQNREADSNFQNFANSYRNNYIGWINNAKTGETRQRRIKEVVKRSSVNKKPGM